MKKFLKQALVTVIIPTKNSELYLRKCLNSILKQSYRPIEIIVVDNHSIDDTRAIAQSLGARVLVKGPERAAQTNAGMNASNGKYLYRVDSDFLLDEDVISEAVVACEGGHLDGIAVHNISAPGLGFWSEVRNLERDTYRDDTLIVGVRFYRKDIWKKLGGYDESVVWDDYDFHNRFIASGYRWGRIESKEYHLGEPKSLWDIIIKSFFYGREMVPYLRKNPDRGLAQANPIRASYFRHWRSFVQHPILTAGFVLMQVAKGGGAMLGFAHALITKNN